MAPLPADDKEFTVETRDVSPSHLLIKIKSFSMLWKRGTRKFESREFAAGDYKWKLILYPYGDDSEKEGDHVSAYLSMVETSSLPMDWEVNAMFSIFLFNQILDNYLCFRGKMRRFHAMNSKWGISKLISKKRLTDPSNGYLVDDSCVFGAEVFVVKSQRVIECVSILEDRNAYKHKFKISQFSKLQDVWTSKEFHAGDYRWKVKLYPDGNNSGKGLSVSMYLECVDSKSFARHQKVKADFCLRIKNKICGTIKSRDFSHSFAYSEQDWGADNFIPIPDMRDSSKGFVVDDCCHLEVEIYPPVVASKSD